MKTPLYVAGRFKIFDAQNKLVATLEPTHRIEAEALVRAYNAIPVLDAVLLEVDAAHDALSEAVEDPHADPSDVRAAAVNVCLALNRLLDRAEGRPV